MARTKKSEDSVKEVKYEHYVKPVKILENFEEIYKLKYHLISSYEELLDFYNNKFDPNSFFAWDTETTDLNPEKGKLTDDLTEGRIVGYSFTQNGNDGYYVPLTHPDIAIGYKGLKVLYAMVSRSKLNLLYNARFDMRFLEHMTPEKYDYIPEPGEKIYPFDLSKIKYFDVQCSVWLSDTNVPMPSLKKSEKHFLGWNPPTFADTMGDETNFGYIPAEQGYRYACIEENTLIKTVNGNKKIKDITVNDTVYSSSGPNKVLAIYDNGIRHTIKCTYKNDYTLVCTSDHKIAVNTVLGPRLVQAKDLDTYATLYTGGINFNDINSLSQDYSTLSFNVSALQNIDFMYWLLGFTMTDGNLVNNRLAYKVQKRDEHILYDIKNYVKSQSKIFETLSKSPNNDNSINIAANLYICNKVCCNFMREHGMTENKSTRKSYNVSDDVFPSFLRGIYDGDGSSNGNNICFIGYPEFIEKLQSDIYRLYGLTSSLHKNKPDDKVIVMTFTKYASLQLMNIMYNNATIFINRKMEKALRKHKLFYVTKDDNYKKRANYSNLSREPVGIEEFQKLDHICKSFNISSSVLSRVISGKWKQYKGLAVTTKIGKLYNTIPKTMTIEDVGDKHVFDIQVENDPSFITNNGFIVHNCIDALGTYHLFFKTEKYYTESGAAGKLDNEVLYPLMKLENTPIYVDHEYLKKMRVDIVKHLAELKQYLYNKIGIEYNINSGRELVAVFQQLGIDTGQRTATGIMKTDIKTIENYLVEHNDNGSNSEYLRKLVEYKKLTKFDNSYLEKLIKVSSTEEVNKHPIRFNYFSARVPTGRLACGTDGKNTFFSPLNFQSLPKPHSHNYHVHKATPEQIANNEDLCGYIFNDDPNGSLGLTEGQDPHLNVRKAFVPKPNEDAVIISVDMKAEELRLAANIYKEPTWINAFNTGQDVHKATALRIFGEDKYCKEARKKAKTANFGILYGSSAYGFHHQFPDMTLEECEDFIDKFKSALPSIEAAQNGAIRFGRKNGYVKTYFGRPRRVKYYFNSPSRSMQNFGKRTCMNTQVQGCAGDALKLMLIRLWKELFVPYKDKGVRWLGTIHDEINVVVPKSLLKEVVPIIMKCQTIKLPDWPVTIEPDLSIGTSFGSLIPWNIIYNDDGTVKELIPQMDEIKEKDLHPGDPVEKDNYIPEVVEDDYDYMK